MGSTTPSSLSSRTSGVEECWSAASAGIRKKIAQAHTQHNRKKAATNSDRFRPTKRFLSGNQSLIAHLLLVFSQPAWTSANVRPCACPQHRLPHTSLPPPLPPTHDPPAR